MHTLLDSDKQPRCAWSTASTALQHYHDTEWGFPVADDIRLFEKLCLESFQAGLSWRTILDKRDHFRCAFKHFDFNQIAQFTEQDVQRLIQDAGIVRHRGKIEAVIHNAQRAQELVRQYGSLAAFFWQYKPDEATLPPLQTVTFSPESVALSKALKKMGWKFVGPITVYAFMEAAGLINNHAENCCIRQKVAEARQNFSRPKPD